MQDTLNKTRKKKDRLAEMWEDLLANPVAPEPPGKERMTLEASLEADDTVAYRFAPHLQLPPLFGLRQTKSEISITARSYSAPVEERLEPISRTARQEEPERFTPAPMAAVEPVRNTWTDSLKNFFGTLVEPANAEPVPISLEVTELAGEASSPMTLEAAHEESLSFSTPFRWDPKPAWINPPVQSNHQSSGAADVQRLAFKPKIPLRPLHKQRFYRRIFFYLRGWLSRRFRQTA